MGKPFEIVYSCDQWNGPWGGVHTQLPDNVIGAQFFPQCDDFILKNGEIRSRPAFTPAFMQGPNPGGSAILVGLAPGFSHTGGTIGSLLNAFTTSPSNLYSLQSMPETWLSILTGGGLSAGLQVATPVSWRVFASSLYFTNGATNLNSWPGGATNTLNKTVAVVGGQSVGALYLEEMGNHLIMMATTEGGSTFGQRVRWSASNVPTNWDPLTNVNAGFTDFLEVPDTISGHFALGRLAYILRTNGVTEMAPTGFGTAPFDFNHVWASAFGQGNVWPYAFAQYGNLGVCIGADNIYGIIGLQFQPIGGMARDAIFQDLFSVAASGAPVVGAIMPFILGAQPGTSNPGQPVYPYLAYYLFIPSGTNSTKVWVYSFEDQSWVRFNIPNLVYGRPILVNVDPLTTQSRMLVPMSNVLGGSTSIGTWDTASFNDISQGSTVVFRVEDIFHDRVPTVRRVILTFRDLGRATITVTINGSNDNGQAVSSGGKVVVIGNNAPTNKLLTQFVDVTLTAFRPQLTITRAANGGPVSLTRVVMTGEVEGGTL